VKFDWPGVPELLLDDLGDRHCLDASR
jgi:hypothetical protein